MHYSRSLFICVFFFCLAFLCLACDKGENPTPADQSPLAEVERILDVSEAQRKKEMEELAAKATLQSITSKASFQQTTPTIASWPPELNQRYPNLTLINSRGEKVSLQSFRGRPLLIEPIGTTCPACQAFSGAHRYGALYNVSPQQGLLSVHEILKQYAQLKLSDSNIQLIQIIFFNAEMQAPTTTDIRTWEKHFKLAGRTNVHVLGASGDLTKKSYNLIPGFQIVDKQFVLRYDSTGHHPTHDLYKELLPALKGFD